MSLSKKTSVWVEQQFITPEQREKILLFEAKKGTRTFWNTAFIIAGSLIGLGICLLIAANWSALSDWLKLICDFALFGGFIYGLYRSTVAGRNGLKELFCVLCFLMVGGTIGLIAQIFQLNGGWHNFALGWVLASFPFIVLTRSAFFNMCWLLLAVSLLPFEKWEEYLKPFFKDLTLLQPLVLVGLYSLYAACKQADEKIHSFVALPKNAARLFLWSAYLLVYSIGCCWGLAKGNVTTQIYAHIIVFGFFAFRMYVALREAQIGPFKRNAILAEIYIFLIFMSHMGVLWKTGLAFIGGGLLVLAFIFILRKTMRYIKRMEAFQ